LNALEAPAHAFPDRSARWRRLKLNCDAITAIECSARHHNPAPSDDPPRLKADAHYHAFGQSLACVREHVIASMLDARELVHASKVLAYEPKGGSDSVEACRRVQPR